ncbi:MAG: hypothetical protein E7Z92_08190 [Cyanobacteria bacterium SIG31]|nr:hypothetical protein [Cyanobacteria bacterium SIG31]
MLAIKNSIQNSNINFQAAPRVKHCVNGVKFSTIDESYIIKKAMKDVFKKLETSETLPIKIRDILSRYNIKIKNFSEILLPISGIGLTSLFLSDKDRSLNVKIQAPNEELYIIQDESVCRQEKSKKKRYTKNEAIALNIDEKLSKIFEILDSSLLEIRKCFIQKPIIKNTDTPITDNTSKVEETNTEKKENTKKTYKYETYNTSKEVDEIIKNIKIGNQIKETSILKSQKDANIGRLSPTTVALLEEVDSLHSKIVEQIVQQGPKALYRLKRKCINYGSLGKNYTITLKNLNNDGIGITYVTPNTETLLDKNIKVIYIRNKNGEIVDILPIQGNTILAMQNKYKPNVTKSPTNYISTSPLSPEQINSKNLRGILEVLKKEFENMLQIVSNEGGKLNNELIEKISQAEKDISLFKEKIAAKRCRPKDITLRSDGSVILKNINKAGDRIHWLPSHHNHKIKNATHIRLITKDDEFVDNLVIQEGKVIANAVLNNKLYRQKKLKFYRSEEIENFAIEKRLNKILEYFQAGKENFDTEFDNILNFKNKMKNFFRNIGAYKCI